MNAIYDLNGRAITPGVCGWAAPGWAGRQAKLAVGRVKKITKASLVVEFEYTWIGSQRKQTWRRHFKKCAHLDETVNSLDCFLVDPRYSEPQCVTL